MAAVLTGSCRLRRMARHCLRSSVCILLRLTTVLHWPSARLPGVLRGPAVAGVRCLDRLRDALPGPGVTGSLAALPMPFCAGAGAFACMWQQRGWHRRHAQRVGAAKGGAGTS